jgi:hypothetical protein
VKDARERTVDQVRARGPERERKTRSKEVRYGLARTRREPQVLRDSSPCEGTMCKASVRSWQSGRMHREKVSCGGFLMYLVGEKGGGILFWGAYDGE